ncbi:MAG: SDR family oxidoreductase [Nitrososphaerales archaeon]|mgnify:FL=1|jgi:NAD(P)-dependent dehydrogenase (short-subunit alcohol dehydrogenase family)|nr:SDR family oxidoreductase [Nitrososphaerales archaeon]|tara:strand:+ start:3785 stop:4642 length:858 start_codon:yes stop_codon:yes gene_type:complete
MVENSKVLKGKVCMVTGATAGIGIVTAKALAQQGATVIVAGRNKEKSVSTVDQIRKETGNHDVEYILADLSVQKEVRKLSDDFKSKFKRLDILVNNAGAVFDKRFETADGLEMTFALNHLSYFLLTDLLLDTIKASVPSRIINVSSDAHKGAKINFDDIQGKKKYGAMRAYGQSKLANILFTYELARKLEGSGVTSNALHPGFVASSFGSNMRGAFRLILRFLQLFAMSSEKGAETSIYLATSPDVANINGKYFVKKKEVRTSVESYDKNVGEKLWEVSEELTKK